MIEPGYEKIPITRQCELLRLSRSSYYYVSDRDDSYNQLLMNRIDEQFTKTPFYGVPKMTVWLRRQGHSVNPKRVRRLMRLMGLEAVYPEPCLSKASPENRKYPYLLKDLVIDHPDQVWCADMTYIRMLHGFVYLTVIMDWYSHYVLSWEISTTMDSGFCVSALDQALELSRPEIFNTDQGSQFTSTNFLKRLEEQQVRSAWMAGAWTSTSSSTTWSGFMSLWGIAPPTRFMSRSG